MEKTPYGPRQQVSAPPPVVDPSETCSNDWRNGLPTLNGSRVTVRELQEGDAAPLFAAISPNDVSRFLSPPPPSVEGFERFIAWAHRQRAVGQVVAFASVPRGSQSALDAVEVQK